MRRPFVVRTPSGPRGQITWVTLLLLLSLSAAGYLAAVWGPVWVVHYEVMQVVRDHMNQAVRNREDSALVERMASRIRALEKVERVDAHGRLVKVPAVDLRPNDVTWERDLAAQPPILRVAFSYTREVTYPWLERTAEKTFDVDLENELEVPDWGSQR
jgi:hypothetical protein